MEHLTVTVLTIIIYLTIRGGKNYINTYFGYSNNHTIMELNNQILYLLHPEFALPKET